MMPVIINDSLGSILIYALFAVFYFVLFLITKHLDGN